MTKDEMILHAMAISGLGTFSKADIVAVAFRHFPAAFSLWEYSEYPDSNRVWACLYGRRGLLATGKVKRLAGGKFSLAHYNHGCSECGAVEGLIDGKCWTCKYERKRKAVHS